MDIDDGVCNLYIICICLNYVKLKLARFLLNFIIPYPDGYQGSPIPGRGKETDTRLGQFAEELKRMKKKVRDGVEPQHDITLRVCPGRA